MPVTRTILLNGGVIGSLDDFYTELSRAVPLPGHFGRNLDALWDVLSADLEGPFEIVWQHSDESKKRMGKAFDAVAVLLRDLEEEREDFRLILEP